MSVTLIIIGWPACFVVSFMTLLRLARRSFDVTRRDVGFLAAISSFGPASLGVGLLVLLMEWVANPGSSPVLWKRKP